ncbi:hypothetical protein ACFQU7_39215 [Pseudoroseomonas wenyumeiae]
MMHGVPPLHSGEWGLATAEICLALLESARSGRDVTLKHQGPAQTAMTQWEESYGHRILGAP